MFCSAREGGNLSTKACICEKKHALVFLLGLFVGFLSAVFLFIGILLVTGILKRNKGLEKAIEVSPEITLRTMGLWVLAHLGITASLVIVQEFMRRKKNR
ncbi:hypothetical protein CRM22_002770 [Opisthorchis felineus]|uniref:Uncharacterized protein n=1 Tax=Opisthorchis felineus TaxID=147828 RepID=A0A4S2MAP6_OPIFE|nr:hypothetical protein CRM22_002770 [Opisthorchis felineus]